MAEPLKNGFDQALVERVADAGVQSYPSFDRSSFLTAVMAELDDLELKDRINLIADQVRAHLPAEYPEALPHVVTMAATVAGPIDDAGAWGTSMEAWPLCSVVERHGVEHPAESLAAMPELTRAFSCEFAIRPFLQHHLDTTLVACHEWVGSDIAAVRRLPSEGTRPYLPWGPKVPALVDDPELGIALLQVLRHDPDEVVRRSVANHLNDIARHQPDRVAEIAADWLADPTVEPSMVRHALRGLVKKGHVGAMHALGFSTNAEVKIERFTVSPGEVRLGESIELTCEIHSTAAVDQRLVVDFVVHHVGARGDTSPKVFKWTTIELPSGGSVTLTKRRLIQTASTRRYRQGVHRVELQIAGTVVAETAFDLLESS